MKKACYFFIFLSMAAPISAKTVYVTDNLELPLRSEESTKGKIISLLPTGTPLTVVNENSKSGFYKVQLQSGTEGFIATRNTMVDPPSHSQPGAAAKIIETLQSENNALKDELNKLKASITPGTPIEKSLADHRDRLEKELTELKKTAANQIQLKTEHDDLQEQVVDSNRQLEQLKLENTALKDGSNQDWFLYGGILALAGVGLGFILPKIGWRRKNNWDNF